MPKISIIVPVYNVELYLQRCIESILIQTFSDFECIIINDGSTDNCPAICDDFAMMDNRVTVIHQKNSGVSAARNVGLNIARGEWIGFVDSDDWCEPEMFEFLYKNAREQQVDISMCGIRYVTSGNMVSHISKKCPDLIMDSNTALLKFFTSRYFGPYSWNKLVNRRLFFLYDEKLCYDESIKVDEDRLLFFHLLKRAKKIYYSSQVYYNCYSRCNSVSNIARAKGVTVASLTAYDAYVQMLQIETEKRIRHRISARKGAMAARSCLLYLKANGFLYDDKYLFLKTIVKKNITYIFFVGDAKEKMYSSLVFVPFIFKIYCKFMNLIHKDI